MAQRLAIANRVRLVVGTAVVLLGKYVVVVGHAVPAVSHTCFESGCVNV